MIAEISTYSFFNSLLLEIRYPQPSCPVWIFSGVANILPWKSQSSTPLFGFFLSSGIAQIKYIACATTLVQHFTFHSCYYFSIGRLRAFEMLYDARSDYNIIHNLRVSKAIFLNGIRGKWCKLDFDLYGIHIKNSFLEYLWSCPFKIITAVLSNIKLNSPCRWKVSLWHKVFFNVCVTILQKCLM